MMQASDHGPSWIRDVRVCMRMVCGGVNVHACVTAAIQRRERRPATGSRPRPGPASSFRAGALWCTGRAIYVDPLLGASQLQLGLAAGAAAAGRVGRRRRAGRQGHFGTPGVHGRGRPARVAAVRSERGRRPASAHTGPGGGGGGGAPQAASRPSFGHGGEGCPRASGGGRTAGAADLFLSFRCRPAGAAPRPGFGELVRKRATLDGRTAAAADIMPWEVETQRIYGSSRDRDTCMCISRSRMDPYIYTWPYGSIRDRARVSRSRRL